MATRTYLSRRMAMLVANIDQMHKEIELINNLLRDEHKATAPQPLDGLTSGSSSMRRPMLPTPLREMAPAMRQASEELERHEARHTRNASDSYFPPVYGMETAHTVPPQLPDAGVRKKPALTSARSELDMRGKNAQEAIHPAHRPAVPGQSRFPNFSRLKRDV
jgi:hypothetical protein